jgi:hypothetical protein
LLDLYKPDKTKLKFNYLINNRHQIVDLYLFIPENQTALDKGKISDTSWLNGKLLTERRYHYQLLSLDHFEKTLAEFLLKETSNKNGTPTKTFGSLWQAYRLSISAEIKAIKANSALVDIDRFIEKLSAIQQQLSEYPHDCEYLTEFEDILNWYTYQSLQRLIVFCDKKQEGRLLNFLHPLKKMTQSLLKTRKAKSFSIPRNSKQLSEFLEDQAKKKNKLQLTSLMEEQSTTISKHYQTIFLGVIAAVAMLGIYTLLVFISGNSISGNSREISLPILIPIALGYGFREFFQENIKRSLGDRYKQYFYYLTRQITDTHSKKIIARQWVAIRWLQRRTKKKVSQLINHLNLSDYHILHYRCKTKLEIKNFPKDCIELEETLTLDLTHAIENMLPNDLPIFLNHSRTKQIKKLNPLYKCYLLIKTQHPKKQFIFEFHLNKNNIINLKSHT